MAVRFYDLGQYFTATIGTGTLALTSLVPGYNGLTSDQDGQTFNLLIRDGNAWEHSLGVYDHTAETITRELVKSSTGSKLDLSGNAVRVSIGDVSAADLQAIADSKLLLVEESGSDVLPVTDDTTDLGSSSQRFVDGRFSGTLHTKNILGSYYDYAISANVEVPPQDAGIHCYRSSANPIHEIVISGGNRFTTGTTRGSMVGYLNGITKQINANWSAGNNAGGFYSGLPAANTIYYIIAIQNESDGSWDVYFDTNTSATHRPTGYFFSYFQVIGTFKTDAAGNIAWVRSVSSEVGGFSYPIANGNDKPSVGSLLAVASDERVVAIANGGQPYGLKISNNASDPDHDLNIAAGQAWSYDRTTLFRLGSSITKQFDSTWAAGTNTGGLDSGSMPISGGIFIYLIDGDVIGSTSDPSVGPSGYSSSEYAYIGWRPTNSSANFRTVIQSGTYHQLNGIQLFNTQNPGTGNVDFDCIAPPHSIAELYWLNYNGTGFTLVDYFVSSTDVTPGKLVNEIVPSLEGNRAQITDRVIVDAFSQARYRVSYSNASVYARAYIQGWFDPGIQGLGSTI